MIPTLKKILLIEKTYNSIFKEKTNLHGSRKKKNHDGIEDKIQLLCNDTLDKIKDIKSKDNKIVDLDYLNNIRDGCFKLINNPYCELNGYYNNINDSEKKINELEKLIKLAIYAIDKIDIDNLLKNTRNINSNQLLLTIGKKSQQLTFRDMSFEESYVNDDCETLCELSEINKNSSNLKELILKKIKDKYRIDL